MVDKRFPGHIISNYTGKTGSSGKGLEDYNYKVMWYKGIILIKVAYMNTTQTIVDR